MTQKNYRLRRAAERGHGDHGWLDSRHTFSFGQYFDPEHQGYGALRVINEDRVAPGAGFDTHGHRDMEIVSIVLSGELEHKDSMGNGSIIRAGDVQRMTAGTGVTHSEFNASQEELAHFLQIWIVPEREGLTPGYEQTAFASQERRGAWQLVASRDGRAGSVTIHQDVDLHVATLEAGSPLDFELAAGRRGWLHVATGSAEFAGVALAAGDGVAFEAGAALTLLGDADVLLFDLA
ncbi:MAG: pirin family protein [Pseudomonadota bacterium]